MSSTAASDCTLSSTPGCRDQPAPSTDVDPAPALQEDVNHTLDGLFHSDPHRFQLKDWRIEEKTLRLRIHRKEQNLSSAQSEIYQLFGLFSLFQGVIFSAVAQTSLLRCRDWWSPFSMSLMVSIATLLALRQKLKHFGNVQRELIVTKGHAAALFDSINELIKQGNSYDLDLLQPEVAPEFQVVYSNIMSRMVYEYFLCDGFILSGFVIVLSVIILFSCRRILCERCSCSKS